ncbi:helix-turn-helix domain-containing protein [Latilactobacillus sakei]|uniref:helix-turn-helix domain-containing protein n=1 Tax=Latilactobacillus sakei TaxID=1599 RepID=UPI003F53414D
MIKHLKELRSEANWTQQEVADRLGISRANYSHVENNRNEPDNELLVKIADLYEVSTDYLLGKTNTRDKTGAIKEAEINDDQVIMTFDGKPIPPEDLDLIRRLLRGKE